MKKIVAATLAALALTACNLPLKKHGARPQPLVISQDNTVVDGGAYESISIDGAHNVEIKNVIVDGRHYDGDPLQLGADCLYVKDSGDVSFHNSACIGSRREGVAVISTKPGATVAIDHVSFAARRYTWDLEPNLSTQKIGNFRITNTTATGGFGWGIKPCGGIVESVFADNNIYDAREMTEGFLPCGQY
jgi:Prokaryotic membrane lipoprotein lipid attachment site